MAKITIEGLDKLEKALKSNVTLNDVRRVVRSNGVAMQRNMQGKADFKMGYQTGTTKRSIGSKDGIKFYDSNLTVEVGPTTDYASYVEYGTRFMSAQPFIRPAHNEQKEKFKRDLSKLVK